ncbi:hypothetical protein [Rhodococcus jostii]|uniref:Cysteine dioxygenase n=1 Tax=Rhodococcus jostii TaxID=132919 RepID=A0ABU4CEI8_RHOJO|nr:hypothetical protein [Rhodococcus jostii]MDV6281975.1 hypothetical protein [Rhodococcus jostii]
MEQQHEIGALLDSRRAMPERIYDRTIAEDLNPVFDGDGASELVCGLVRFTPGARTNWHAHGNGQLPPRGWSRSPRSSTPLRTLLQGWSDSDQ